MIGPGGARGLRTRIGVRGEEGCAVGTRRGPGGARVVPTRIGAIGQRAAPQGRVAVRGARDLRTRNGLNWAKGASRSGYWNGGRIRVGVGVAIGIGIEISEFDPDPDSDTDTEVRPDKGNGRARGPARGWILELESCS